ncbi:MAG TPA: hypothetical protein VHX37_03810 [Acidobacteriaceae bacterium]|jgi:hypothetical protein|nr:hypothetical protein [Acidobacteriaceae bacterium]
MVSARWLLSAFLLTLLAAALCGYATLGLLFYQGQWQLLFHPSRAISNTPLKAGIPFDNLEVPIPGAGHSHLNAWWIPAAPASQYATDTVLYLHDAHGSLSDTVPALLTLHSLGINVFAFDYRGFGLSDGRHPTERLGTADSIAAWTWLTDTRHILSRNIVLYGDGTGTVFAAHLAARFAPAGVILEDPAPTARQIFSTDARARILPLWLLQKEHLDPVLARAHAPLLFLNRSGDAARIRALFNAAPYPKQIYDLHAAPPAAVPETLRRFLDEVLHEAAPNAIGNP